MHLCRLRFSRLISSPSIRNMATDAVPKKTVLVPIAEGSEEIEALPFLPRLCELFGLQTIPLQRLRQRLFATSFTCIVDILRRGEVDVTVASVMSQKLVKCSRGVKIEADVLIDEVKGKQFDAIILPGGMPGAKNLGDNAALKELLANQIASDKLYGAVCASPVIALQANGFLKGKRATAFPAHAVNLENKVAVEEDVVIDGNLITSKAVGTSLKFGVKILELLRGKDVAEDVRKRALIPEF